MNGAFWFVILIVISVAINASQRQRGQRGGRQQWPGSPMGPGRPGQPAPPGWPGHMGKPVQPELPSEADESNEWDRPWFPGPAGQPGKGQHPWFPKPAGPASWQGPSGQPGQPGARSPVQVVDAPQQAPMSTAPVAESLAQTHHAPLTTALHRHPADQPRPREVPESPLQAALANRDSLVQALVLSEVLGKPKALRGRG